MAYLCSLQGLLDVFKQQSLNPYHSQISSTLPEGICREFSVAEIKAATNNFDPVSRIGKGGFGPVYRGTIDGTKAVAIKCHDGKSLPQMFRNEVVFLCQLRHPHLVSLIGICYDQKHIFVVYEYMTRRSLAHHLHTKNCPPLVWEHRLQICIGAARGLHYLHTGAKYVVIHRDIRSSNIVLDDEWSCKLTGFGFSKLGPLSSMSKPVIKKMEPNITGTEGELTEKCDVFAFGVVLFEVLCARKVHNDKFPRNQQSLLERAIQMGREGSIYDAIDPYLKGTIAPECLNKYLEIACSCIHYKENQRPDMGEVEVVLELAMELQKKADSEMEVTIPHGDQWMYEDASVPSSVFDACYDRNYNSL